MIVRIHVPFVSAVQEHLVSPAPVSETQAKTWLLHNWCGRSIVLKRIPSPLFHACRGLSKTGHKTWKWIKCLASFFKCNNFCSGSDCIQGSEPVATCHGTYQVLAAAVITEVGIRGRHVNAYDYIKGLQSEVWNLTVIVLLCSTLMSHFTHLLPDNKLESRDSM